MKSTISSRAVLASLFVYLFFTCQPIWANTSEYIIKKDLIFDTSEAKRGSFHVATYSPKNGNIRGTLIQIYGGAAGARPFGTELYLSKDFGEPLVRAGYKIVIPDYRAYLNREKFDVRRVAYGTEKQHRDDFKTRVNTQISDLIKFIKDYSEQYPHEKIFIFGHSYGGYLSNFLA